MKKFILSLFVVALSLSSSACEICGCGMGNYYIGIMPQFDHRFIGLRYQFHHFKTRLRDDPTQFSNDLYQTIELWSGWNLGKRWQLLVFVPFNINHQNSDEGITNKNGLGDIALLANYKVFDHTSATGTKRIEQTLWLGAGFKLPTGKFDIDPGDPDVASAANTQIGSGSTDILLNALYDVRINKWGISTSANYKINTTNKSEYRFGNKFSANSFVYRSFSKHSGTAITPNLGLLYEHSASNKLQSARVDLTGGDLLMAAAGTEFSFKKVTVGLNVQLPVTQNFAEDQTRSKLKGMFHVTFSL